MLDVVTIDSEKLLIHRKQLGKTCGNCQNYQAELRERSKFFLSFIRHYDDKFPDISGFIVIRIR